MVDITIIIPFNSKDPYRQQALKYIQKFYKTQFPNANIILATEGNELYSKSVAINRAARKSTTRYLAIIDGDILCPREQILAGLILLNQFSLVIPYTDVIDLSRQASQKLYSDSLELKTAATKFGKKRNSKKTMPVGGINLIKKSCFMKVKGFDERYIGWGGEDDAFVASCNTLCGPSKRITGPIYHLWHPTPRHNGNPNYNNNYRYTVEYFKAYNNKEKMKEILAKRKNI